MRIKSYFSGTVEAAMDLARRELGDEAVILNSRPAPAEARHLGAYEVVFGVDDTAPSPAPPVARQIGPTSPSKTALRKPGGEPGHRFEVLEGEIVALRQELRKMSRGILAPDSNWKVARAGLRLEPQTPETRLPVNQHTVNQHTVTQHTVTRHQERELIAYLVSRELPEAPAGELVRRARERLRRPVLRTPQAPDWAPDRTPEGVTPGWQRPPSRNATPGLFPPSGGVFTGHPGLLAGMFADESPLAAAVLDELAVVLRTDATLGRSAAGQKDLATGEGKPVAGPKVPKVVAVVGAAGAGKTTTLVKLAAQYGLRGRRPAHIISTDNLRVGAAEQLRSYAAILGVGFDLAETTVALGQLLNEHAGKELILIDTPGLSPGQMEDGASLARFLSADPRVDCHLVVPAYQKAPDVACLLDRFHPYGAAKVILTRLDETGAIGGLLLALDECEARVSFLSMGQTIPEDLEPASVARLLDLFVGDPPMGAFLSADEPDRFEDNGHAAIVDAPGRHRERVLTAGSRA